MKIKVLLTALLTLTSTIAATYGYANSWSAVEGGQVVDGKYQITCGEGTGWQKCGEMPRSCKLTDDDFILVLGYPGRFSVSPTSPAYVGVPYSFSTTITVRVAGKVAKANFIETATATKTRAVNGVAFTGLGETGMGIGVTGTSLATGFGKPNHYVEGWFTSYFGNQFPDLSHMKLSGGDGKLYYPGKLREVYDMETSTTGSGYSGYALLTWYIHELCEVE